MLNKLLLSKNGRNHIRIMPIKDIVKVPEDEGEKIEFCEKLFKDLQTNDQVIRHSYYCNRKKGVLTGVWELDNKIYLDHCFHTADKGIYVATIYIFPKDMLNDVLAIEKFFRNNLSQIGSDYKEQIEDGRKEWIKLHDTRDITEKPN